MRPISRFRLEKFVNDETCVGTAPSQRETISQVVKYKLCIGAVRHIAAIGMLPIARLLPVLDKTHCKAERVVHAAKLLGVASSEIVVDCDNMHRSPHERCSHRGEYCCQGLALASL